MPGIATYLGIDIGSTSIKGAVLDLASESLRAVERVAFPAPLSGLPAGHFEIAPGAVVTAVQELLDRLTRHAPHCAGLLCCSQMGGVILTDARGSPLSNYLSWRDQRVAQLEAGSCETCFARLQRRLTAAELAELGHELKAGAAVSLLFWLAERRQLPRGAIPLSLGDYVISQLTAAAPATEFTNALSALDVSRRDWHRPVLERLGLDELHWPRLVDATRPVGDVRIGGRPVPCYPAVGDHQCALVGAGLAEGELALNISTGSQVGLLSPTYQPGDYQIRPYFDGQFLNTITHLPAGRALNVLIDLLCEMAGPDYADVDPWPYIARAVASAPDTDLEVNLAFFSGPMGDRGAIQGISVDNLTVGTLFRTAFRHMAANYERCARRLSAKGRWRRIVFAGGLAQKLAVLRQIILERFACPSRTCLVTEETLAGLRVLAMVAAGRASTVAAAVRLEHPADTDST